jgi:hypothetical protein
MENKKWFNSKEAKTLLSLSDCQLMHIRLAGKIEFKKEGRGFFYLIKIS